MVDYKKRKEGYSFVGLEKVILERHSNPDHSVLEDIVLAAEHISLIANAANQTPVLFLGRTPCLIQWAYDELYKLNFPQNDVRNHSFHLSFSGSPDAESLRISDFYQNYDNKVARNIVTPERLAFYEDYMTKQGLNAVQEKLFLVDMIGTGGGLNSFIRVMRHYYQEHLKREMPDIHFICLSLTLGTNHEIADTWTFNQEAGLLTFKGAEKAGLRPLSIKTTPLQVCESTLKMLLDNDLAQQHIAHGIEFPAE